MGLVYLNELGRRIGESHPRAKLTDRSIPDLLEHLAILEARESFWAYRQFIHSITSAEAPDFSRG